MLNITSLITKSKDDNVDELIIATNATVEGQLTAQFIAEKFSDTGKLFSVDRSRGGGRGQFIPPITYIVILVSLMILLF